MIGIYINRAPTGSSSSTAQPNYTPKELGGNYRCLDCEQENAFGSEEELKRHRDETHSGAQGKRTKYVP